MNLKPISKMSLLNFWSLAAAAAISIPLFATPLSAADLTEQQAIAVLQSDASLQQKDAACARLKHIGTAQSIPALAGLLTDEKLSHSARYALESMPYPEASRALVEALDKTSGLTRVGVITSLANRREAMAQTSLTSLLKDPDSATSAAAALALGRIGGEASIAALQSSLANATGPTRKAVLDSLLHCANSMVSGGNNEAAFAIFKQLYQPKEDDFARTAAYSGMIRAGGGQSLELALDGIQGNDSAAQIAALQLARDIKDPGTTKSLCDLLPNSGVALQIALIEALGQRGDTAAESAVASLVKSPEVTVRISALNALGILGDASVIPLLAAKLEATDPSEQKAAQLALLQVRRGNVTEALMTQVASATPSLQSAIMSILADRAEKSSLPQLLAFARTGNEIVRKAALQALSKLADAQHVPALVQLLVDAKTEQDRSGAEEALASIYQRSQGKQPFDVSPIVQGMARGNADSKAALLNACSLLVAPEIRTVLRSAITNPDAQVRAAAIRALCNSRDPELLPDIARLVRTSDEANVRSQAIRGYVRLVTEEEKTNYSMPQRAALLKEILALAKTQQEKWAVLAGLARVPHPDALQLAVPMLEQPGLQAESAQAVTQISAALQGSHPELVRTSLRKMIAVTTDPGRRQAAEKLLSQMDAMADFITAWQVSGPYEQNGKNFDALFDTAFVPEKPDPTAVSWRALPAATDPQRPWLMDLLKAIGGEQRVAYARTRIYSPKAQPARLELGTDDGVKAWLNGKLVHAKNVARPIVVGSDKANVTLREGWNTLVLKITQNNLGWEFCARIVDRDGSRLDGLRFDTNFTSARE